MASYRHLARIAVMQTIFEYEFDRQIALKKDAKPVDKLAYNIKQLSSKVKDLFFARSTLKGVLENQKEIYKILKKNAPEWPVEKIAPVDRAILEIGIYEIVFSDDIPPVVAINESIEIAKVYGDTNSAKFINGVLSAVMTENTNNKKNDK
ncbi:transcription antitermination factor NusB [bacterium]|nr:transcription antitermination factor NusB [bacterium]